MTTMYRADHYEAADRLVHAVRREIAGDVEGGFDPTNTFKFNRMTLQLAAAQVHATLAAAGPGVEQEVKEREKRVAQALGAAEGPVGPARAAELAQMLHPTSGADLVALHDAARVEEAQRSQRARQAARPPLAGPSTWCGRCGRPRVGHEDEAHPFEPKALVDLDALAESMRPSTTCRCTGLPHDLGSPGCEQTEARLFQVDPRQGGKTVRVEETAGTVRPKPHPPSRLTCHCSGVGHERGAVGCAHEVHR